MEEAVSLYSTFPEGIEATRSFPGKPGCRRCHLHSNKIIEGSKTWEACWERASPTASPTIGAQYFSQYFFRFSFFFLLPARPCFVHVGSLPWNFWKFLQSMDAKNRLVDSRQIVLALSLAGSPLAEGGSTLVATSGKDDPRRHHPGASPIVFSRYQGSAVAAF